MNKQGHDGNIPRGHEETSAAGILGTRKQANELTRNHEVREQAKEVARE